MTEILIANKDSLDKAANLLRTGKLVAFPTETVYGLGGNAENDSAVAEIYAVKGRPSFNPLIVHVPDIEMAERYVKVNSVARDLMSSFWPGPLTLVLPRREDSKLSLLVSAGLDTVAIRMPAHSIALALLKAAEIGIAAPSANRSGRISPTQAQHVKDELNGLIPMILDGGKCEVGLESTVLDCTSDKLKVLRPGGITKEMLEEKIGKVDWGNVIKPNSENALSSPGMLESHYAPSLAVRLNVSEVREGEALLAFGSSPLLGAKHMENLSPTGDLKEAAAHLFAFLRMLDLPEYKAIAVMPIPEIGLGVAINDRLRRAAAERK
jgi:L-threonylcarbamoyladenylate synthase